MRPLLSALAMTLTLGAATHAVADDIYLGASIYRFDDTFMANMRSSMQDSAKEHGVRLEIVDAQNRQPMQNDQVDTFITKGVNAMILNIVDQDAAQTLADKAKAADMPLIFVNREPDAKVIKSYKQAYYVGSHGEESGYIAGQLIASYFKENPESDKNQDGKLQYIVIHGEMGHQDDVERTTYSAQALKDAGIEAEEIGAEYANWSRSQGKTRMKAFIKNLKLQHIEAIIANNDDMALGAIEALQSYGYNLGSNGKSKGYIPVVGVDAIEEALLAIADGQMLGTALNNENAHAEASLRIALKLLEGEPINYQSIGYSVSDHQYVWIPYTRVTKDNCREFLP